MRKSTWMAQLERALSREGMTGTEKRTVLNYYEEMYQDRLDDGAEEEDIIKEFGFPEDVAQSGRESAEHAHAETDKGGARKADNYNLRDDVPVGAYVNRESDVEAQGYFRTVPPVPPVPPVQPNNTQGVGGTPVNTAPPKNNSGDTAMSVVRTVVSVLCAIVFFAVGLGLSIGGVSLIAASFATIVFSAGVWLLLLGIGLILFACGCLVFGAAVKFVKSAFKSTDGGVK
ncbi:MAG: DUF1700 domain-containing protein [Clostridia bacterium]|nr:DUF1700 domain-containing protein [Clostridia bacterium]